MSFCASRLLTRPRKARATLINCKLWKELGLELFVRFSQRTTKRQSIRSCIRYFGKFLVQHSDRVYTLEHKATGDEFHRVLGKLCAKACVNCTFLIPCGLPQFG